MQHELLDALALVLLDELGVPLGAQGGRDQGLGLAAGEERRAVGAGEEPGLDVDGPDLVEPPVVEAGALVDHHLAEDLLFEPADDLLDLPLLRRLLLGDGLEVGLDHGVDGVLALELLLGEESGLQGGVEIRLDLLVERLGVDLRRRPNRLLRLPLAEQLVLRLDDLLDLQVAAPDALEHQLLGDLVGPGFHHHHRLFGADHDEIEVRHVAQAVGGVHHHLAVDQAHPHRAHRVVERDVGEHQRHRGAVDGQDVRIVLAVGREAEGDDLGVGGVAFGEQGAQRAVDLAGGDDLLLRRPAFALEEAPGNAARGVGVLAIVDRQRQEVPLGGTFVLHAGRGEHDRIAVADGAGPVGLLGQVTRFDDQGPRADGNLFALPHDGLSSFFRFVFFACLSPVYSSGPGPASGPRQSRGGRGASGAGGSDGPETSRGPGLRSCRVGRGGYLRSPRRSMVER